jgi:hypothetical protein
MVGALVATYLGQAIGWYEPDQGAGLIGATFGAVLILLVWGYIERKRQPEGHSRPACCRAVGALGKLLDPSR